MDCLGYIEAGLITIDMHAQIRGVGGIYIGFLTP